jgi:CheY-like chemotaxis protein
MNHKHRILMIDDDPGVSGIVKRQLERTGAYEVRTAHDGVNGLQVAREFQPHLLLLDVVMPDCDGGNVLARFRDDDGLREIKVIFLTGTVSEENMEWHGGQIAKYPVVSKQAALKTLTGQIERTLSR